MKQEVRIAIANDTLQIIEAGYYLNKEGRRVEIAGLLESAKAKTRLYTPDELGDLLAQQGKPGSFETRYEVSNETTLDAMRRLAAGGSSEVMILNFASAKNPGGGFLGGALAQEECIARASGLYPCLLMAPAYYKYHRTQSSMLYSDHMIYSPGVPVWKDEAGEALETSNGCILIRTDTSSMEVCSEVFAKDVWVEVMRFIGGKLVIAFKDQILVYWLLGDEVASFKSIDVSSRGIRINSVAATSRRNEVAVLDSKGKITIFSL